MKLPLMKSIIVVFLLISVGCGNVTGTSSSGKGADAPSFTAIGLDNQEVDFNFSVENALEMAKNYPDIFDWMIEQSSDIQSFKLTEELGKS